jgi:anaerobic magnesium-protoporphyrin IX monomethyl ester cyclase
MAKRILLVTTNFEENPIMFKEKSNEQPSLHQEESGKKVSQETIDAITNSESYPIGLAYLYSYLKKYEYNPTILHLNYYYEDDCYKKILKTIEMEHPETVAFQMLTSNRTSTCRVIEKIHSMYPKIKIILGGIHATLLYKQLIDKYPFTFIIIGEGEETLIELLNEFPKKNPNYRKIKGLVYSNRGKAIMTPTRPLIEDLDSLPFPAHHQFINKDVIRACILTSRGCPFKCSFCCINPHTKRKVRFRSVENVLEEIDEVIRDFPWLKEIWFYDDTLFLDNKRTIEICKGIIKRKTKIEFTCCGRVKPISEEMIYYLEKANFKSVLIGVESGSAEVLAKTGKGITPKEVIEAFEKFRNSKISLKPFHIIGLPGENLKTAIESARFFRELQKIKYDYYGNQVNYLKIYPGTRVYDIAKEKGVIDDNYWNGTESCPFFFLENTPEQLYEYGEIFLNHVSLDRIMTVRGFSKQWMMFPYIIPRLIKKVWRNPILIKKVIAQKLEK